MEENEKKEILNVINHERMKTKAVLEKLRALEESSKISFQREIDVCLDQLKNLEDLYEEIKNK